MTPHLMTIPTETRDSIFKYTLAASTNVNVRRGFRSKIEVFNPKLSLLLVNKQAYAEVKNVAMPPIAADIYTNGWKPMYVISKLSPRFWRSVEVLHLEFSKAYYGGHPDEVLRAEKKRVLKWIWKMWESPMKIYKKEKRGDDRVAWLFIYEVRDFKGMIEA